MVDLALGHANEIESRFSELREAHPERTPVELLVKALGVTYVPSVKPVRSGDQLYQHHCSMVHVTARFPRLYEVETQLLSRLLGSHVQWLATIAYGGRVYTIHVLNPVILNRIRK